MSAEVASADPNPRAVRAAYAAESLSSRTMRLGNAMVAAGIFSSAGFVLQHAAHELHALAAAQVDRRVQVHHATTPTGMLRTQLRSRSRPAWPDFSGWTWVATTLPRTAMAATGPP